MTPLPLLRFAAATALVLTAFAPFATRAEDAVTVVEQPLPAGIPESFHPLLKSRATRFLQQGQPIVDFWFVEPIPLAKPYDAASKGLDSLTDTSLLGIAVVHKDQRDYRDDAWYAGTYTMRLGLRPNDGNHLGTSDYRYFAVLTPVKLDPAPNHIKTAKQLVEASRKETATDHPFILSLRPGPDGDGMFPRLNAPAPEHVSVLVKLPATFEGTSSSLIMDLVVQGVAQH